MKVRLTFYTLDMGDNSRILGGQKSSTKEAYAKQAHKWQRWARASLALILGSAVGISILYTSSALGVLGDQLLLVMVAVCVLVSVGAQVFVGRLQVEKRWFQGRAVAETAKSLSWQYMMSIGDLQDPEEADQRLVKFLDSARDEFKNSIKPNRLGISADSEITSDMKHVRSFAWEKKRELYVERRIRNQISWYEEKSKSNQRKSTWWGRIALVVQVGGIVIATYAVLTSQFPGAPSSVSLMATAVASIIGWAKARRYSELVEPYTYTGQTLKEMDKEILKASDEDSFKALVLETEHAISKEHQMWQLRSGLGIVKHLNA